MATKRILVARGSLAVTGGGTVNNAAIALPGTDLSARVVALVHKVEMTGLMDAITTAALKWASMGVARESGVTPYDLGDDDLICGFAWEYSEQSPEYHRSPCIYNWVPPEPVAVAKESLYLVGKSTSDDITCYGRIYYEAKVVSATDLVALIA